MFSKRSPIHWLQVITSIAVSFLLVLALAPLIPPRTASASPGNQAQSDEDSAALLAAGEYAEGEAIVIVDETVSGNSTHTRSTDLLAQSESLMTVTEEVYEATLEDTPASVQAEPENGMLRSLNTASEETISIRSLTGTGMSTEELLSILRDDPRVLAAEPNYVHQLDIQEDESVRGQSSIDTSKITDLTDYQWGNSNTDKTLMTKNKEIGFDINIPSWDDFRTDTSKKNASGTVAVLDTGIDYTHPDLKNIMRNDMASYVSYGGAYGYTSYEGYADPTDPMDDNSHGTHCAGIIAAEWNDYGISGVASGVSMVAVKAANADGAISTKAVVKGYAYLAEAMKNGLDLKAINNSWGGPDVSQAFSLAVMQLGELGAISVVASGNEATNIDYVAATASTLSSNPYAVVVNSSTMNAALSPFSNYGQVTTDIVAPGSDILSTVPLSMGSYMPEATKDNLVFESFSSGFSYAFSTSKLENPWGEIGGASSDYYFDTDRSSWAIKVEYMEPTNLNGLTAYKFYATVDVPEVNQEDARYLGFSAYSTGGTETAILVASIPTTSSTSIIGVAGKDRGGWRSGSVDLTVDSAGNPASPAYNNTKMTISFVLYSERQDIEATDVLYLDAIGVGAADTLVPYDYKSGTSMATPAATGAAMILAGEEDGSLNPSEAALARAQKLAGSVRPVDEFAGICTSGGALDLSKDVPPVYTPVLSSATLHTEGGVNELTINGSFFGTAEGIVTISDRPASVKTGTWTETSVTVSIPDNLSSGVHTVALTTADDGSGNARTGQKAFLLTLPSPPSAESTPLFETEYSLPSYEEGFPADLLGVTLAGLGGYLYLLPANDSGVASTMWRLDPKEGTWFKCAAFPEKLSRISATSYKGLLAVAGEQEEVAGVSLFFYDSQTDSWDSSRKGLALPPASTIANWNENLLFFGGLKDFDETGNPIGEDMIFAYDPETGTVGQIGTMITGRVNPSVAVQGDTIVVTGQTYEGTDKEAELVSISMSSVTSENITGTLPDFVDGSESHYAVAPVAGGVVLSGASAKKESSRASKGVDPTEDHDTYILDTSDQSASFKAFGKRISSSQLFYVSAAAYRGALYTFGTSYYEEGGYVLRATAVETLDQPGDLYTITYHNTTAGEHGNPTTYTASGLPLSLMTAHDRQDARFAGWYQSAELTGEPVTSIAAGTTGDIALWAQWEAVGSKPSVLTTTGDPLTKSTVGALLLVITICSAVIGVAARRRGGSHPRR